MTNRFKEFLWKLKLLLKEPLLFLLILVLLFFLTLFVIFPFVKMLYYSLTTEDGKLTFSTLVSAFTNKGYRTTFFNSMKLGVITAIIGTIIGYMYAYAITRTNMPWKPFFKTMATLPIISPPFVLSLSIIFLFGRKGLITNSLLGITNFDVYGMKSLIVIQVMSFFPIAYLTLSGILESIDTSVSLASQKPEERFKHLMQTRAELFQRVPRKFIANLLGISPESLSRLQKRIYSKNKNS